jgi:putative protease
VEEVCADGTAVVEVRNRLQEGETVEFIGRGMLSNQWLVTEMIMLGGTTAAEGVTMPTAHPNQRIKVRVPFPVAKYDLLRREKKRPIEVDGVRPDLDTTEYQRKGPTP